MSSDIDVSSGGAVQNGGAGSGEVPARTSDRGAATRGALLAAARDVFCESGFAQAAVTDIVAKAGASVGSLYHHFNGKADLYLTLFDDFQGRQQERTREAINALREAGETDPMQQFIAGAGAYLDGCLDERDVARLFISGDGPPGFDRVNRQRLNKWARRNAALFHTADGGVDEALVTVLTGAMAGAVSEIALLDDEQAARRLADEIMAIVGTIRNPGTERR
ncbi:MULTISPECIES: TetR/AcrR family transcriptional regulator [Actinomadura]|uniref:DNA-binding transcriptional regulator, AcrR family n=1 Tax=Actinomadura madurae TaxID=1993 RepID=A0A1I5D5W5_9ACTN|nr:TetR/AcrR family transcriptional regulator [Actinomadura madurae]SFN94516.1 DNA-binding transcriptional regulator, AcrR family [Actinomadura madurae]SPT50449.1 HTH-type transcriptional repressor BepR [Actinomadura madurae]